MTTMTTIATTKSGDASTTRNRIELYTDGSALGNPGPAGYAFVALLLDETGTVIDTAEQSKPSKRHVTNNRAEMAAAINGLAFIREQSASGLWPTSPITLVSDSQYLVKGFTEWLPGWIAKGWRKSDKKLVENRDLWEQLIGQTEGLAVDWRWVRGHDGNEWNERAHELATAASAEAKRQGVIFRIACD
ncbi:ribonuclease H [Cereibacter sphaeroides]|uniref:ribonuclease H family protein n=1 Tax=Cereibacter sphaeroides TaxID=1063 RepID=UPI00313E1014